MKRTAFFIVALALTACDSEPPDTSEARLAELEAEDGDDLDEVEGAHHGREHDGGRHHGKRGKKGKRGKHNPASEICEQVACSDAQLEQVQAAFARPEHGERPERPDMTEANATIAAAFAGSEFAVADLQAWRAQRPERSEGGHLDRMSELHAILTAEQRVTFASKIAAGEALGGKHDGGCDKDGGKGEAQDDRQERRAEHLGRRVEHFCAPLECTEDQQSQLTAIFERKHDGGEDRGDRKAALAEAFGAASFDAEAVAALMKRGHDEGAKDAAAVELHGVLTAEQRAKLAEQISEQGPRALMGGHSKRGGKHGRHGKRRGHKRRGHKGGQDGGPEFG